MGSGSQVGKGNPFKGLGLSQRANKLTAQPKASCSHKEQSEISLVCTEGRMNAMLMGKGHQGRLHGRGGI